jgi:hypothetical protein
MIEIRPYREGDEKEIIKLFKICFGREISYKEWRWKYKKSPWGSVSYVVLNNNKLVSHYGGLKYLFYTGEKILSAYQTCDVMTHPDHRAKFFTKKPLVVKAGEMFYMDNAMEFAFGFPSERHARLQQLVLGCSKYKKPILFRKKLSAIENVINRSCSLEIGWDMIDSNDLENLWKASRKNNFLSIVKDSKYFFWRYLEHPSKYYTLLTLRNIYSNKIEALAVIRCLGQEMFIYDFFLSDFNFFPMLEHYAAGQKAHTLNIAANSGEDISNYLIGTGYKPTEYVPLIVRIVKKEALTIKTFFSNYCFRLGDYDDA